MRTSCCAIVAISGVLIGLCGCGSFEPITFPRQLTGIDGQVITVEDLEAIANDPDLTDDEKRQDFRDLGIEDERLIDALLGL